MPSKPPSTTLLALVKLGKGMKPARSKQEDDEPRRSKQQKSTAKITRANPLIGSRSGVIPTSEADPQIKAESGIDYLRGWSCREFFRLGVVRNVDGGGGCRVKGLGKESNRVPVPDLRVEVIDGIGVCEPLLVIKGQIREISF